MIKQEGNIIEITGEHMHTIDLTKIVSVIMIKQHVVIVLKNGITMHVYFPKSFNYEEWYEDIDSNIRTIAGSLNIEKAGTP